MIFRSDVFYSRTRYFVRFDLIKKKEIKGISSVRTRKREIPARFLKTVLSARVIRETRHSPLFISFPLLPSLASRSRERHARRARRIS